MARAVLLFLVAWGASLSAVAVPTSADSAAILTPPAPDKPRINGPNVFGVRPGSPFLYSIPATGVRPMTFEVDALPAGLSLDAITGRITGMLPQAGEFQVTLRASNGAGAAEKNFRILVGDRIALTPPMGWNSWNCWAASVDQGKIMASAQAMVQTGLSNHGWTYINIDDTWQGARGGPLKAIQPNAKFPDMTKLCSDIHALGLKPGIYSTPWMTSYAGFVGGSSDDPNGAWSKAVAHATTGAHTFETNDAAQFAAWGIDYLKYDWAIDVPHAEAMSNALHASGRDIVLSLSNSAPFEGAADWARVAECWRTSGDIVDEWIQPAQPWQFGMSEEGFAQERWAPFEGPGHWNDPDMLVVGRVGWGATTHETHLTPDEQYSHISLWCMLSAPLLLGCDLTKLSPFTLGLLTNDEVLALDQDALGKQALRVATVGGVDVYRKELEDGGVALGFFNRDSRPMAFTYGKPARIGLPGKWHVRDLWRQRNLADLNGALAVSVNPHGVLLLKLTRAR